MSLENRPDVTLAQEQWDNLYTTLTRTIGVEVSLIKQAVGCPDMVFTANAGLIRGQRVLLSAFRHAERQREVPHFRAWFEAQGYEIVTPPTGFAFEGEGDALYVGDRIVAGYLKRSDIASHQWLSETLECQVLSLELADPRWYHLDTCFFALTPETVVAYPNAFDSYACTVLENHFEVLPLSEEEALRFACNTVVLGKTLVMPAGCPQITRQLEARGFQVFSVDLSEFLKAGGAAKCLVLHLP
jgi:N-dimethylarginine dimethylaminohydrolase